jgi:hypothetical protein
MNRFNPLLAAMVLSASMWAAMFAATAAHAMDVQVYERMSANDQGDYTGVMVGGAEQVLAAAGRADQAAQVEKLFTTREPGDAHTLGMVEFELNLAQVNKADADNLVKNPNAKPLKVEIAMIATLKANGIILPKSFMHVGDNFDAKDTLSPPPRFGPFSQCFAYRHGACVGGILPTTPSRAAPPIGSHPAPPDDDPIGPGGFITPPQR